MKRQPKDFQTFGELTQSQETTQAYQRRAIWLCQRYARENPFRQPENYKGMVVWLLSLRPTLSVNTFLQYKNALVFWLWHENGHNPIARQAAVFLAQQSSLGTSAKGNHTSSKKQKFIAEQDLRVLIAYLDQQAADNTQSWAWKTKLFLLCGIMCGLRLIEWQSAELIQDDDQGTFAIRVKNGKASNGRSNGKVRHIVFSAVNELELAIVQEHINSIQACADFDYYKKQCNATLKKAQLANGMTGNITLSSCRHQFAANGKKTFSESELSALMGHAFTRTAQQRYGHIRHGWAKSANIAPRMEEVATVQKNHTPLPSEKMERDRVRDWKRNLNLDMKKMD